MKRLFRLLSVALVAGSMLALTSCDKEEEARTNTITIDGTDSPVAAVFVINYGNQAGYQGYNTDIAIVANDFQIYFEACSTSASKLDNMTYQYSEVDPAPIGTFTPYSYWNNDTYGSYFTKGNLKVKAGSNGQYELEFSCMDENGDAITGYYKGGIIFQNGQAT